jgi:membrane fusion protein (multidrug efflux system)
VSTIRTRTSRLLLAAVIAGALAGCSVDATPVPKPPTVEPVAVEVGVARRGELVPRLAATARLEAVREADVRAESDGDVLEVLVEEGDHVAAGQLLARLDRGRAAILHRERLAIAERAGARAGRAEALAARGLASADALETDAALAADARLAAGLARADLAHRDLRAPFAGVVARRHVKAGARLAAGEAAFTIVDPSVLRADIEVPERDLALLAAGQPALVTAPVVPACTMQATLAAIAPAIDRRTGTGSARVDLVDRDGHCRPGLNVRVAVEYTAIADAVLVPRVAVVDGAGGPAVFVVEDGAAVRRPVMLGLTAGDEMQVTQGLDGGERVITLGQQRLLSGDPVVEVGPRTARRVARMPAATPAS